MTTPDRPRRRLVLDAVRVVLLALTFYVVFEQVGWLDERMEPRLAEAEARVASVERFREESVRLRRAFEETAVQLAQAEVQLEQCIARIDDQKRELTRLVEERTSILAGDLEQRLELDRDSLAQARSAAALNADRLARLGAAIHRDSDRMKRLMIYPTVQMRGSGTVGSGVVVYSEPQSVLVSTGEEESKPPFTTLILTAYHVVVEVLGDEIDRGVLDRVQLFHGPAADDSRWCAARLVAADPSRDLALLCLDSTERVPHVADLADPQEVAGVDIFSPAYAVGCPLGNSPLPTVGEISSKTKVVGDQTFWMLNAPTFFGNSGGGVYLARDQKLIGISSMIYTYGKANPTVVPHMGLFVPLDVVRDWLRSEGYEFVLERRPVPLERHPGLVVRRAAR